MASFADWLTIELQKRNWSPAEFARRTQKDQGVISRILNGTKPRPETLRIFASALKLPAEEVFRAAGILPATDPDDARRKRLDYKAKQLSAKRLDEYERWLNFQLSEQDREDELKAPTAKLRKSEG